MLVPPVIADVITIATLYRYKAHEVSMLELGILFLVLLGCYLLCGLFK